VVTDEASLDHAHKIAAVEASASLGALASAAQGALARLLGRVFARQLGCPTAFCRLAAT
jgi:hypothetical protein